MHIYIYVLVHIIPIKHTKKKTSSPEQTVEHEATQLTGRPACLHGATQLLGILVSSIPHP